MLKFLSGRTNTAYQRSQLAVFESALKRTRVLLRHVRINMQGGMIFTYPRITCSPFPVLP